MPRLERVLAVQPTGRPCHVRPALPDPAVVLNPAALAALESDSDHLRRQAHAPAAQLDFERLAFAAMHDLGGWPQQHRELPNLQDLSARDPRAIRRLVQEGREKWAKLGAWPWTYFGWLDLTAQDRSWREHPYILAALESWATGSAVDPAVYAASLPLAARWQRRPQ